MLIQIQNFDIVRVLVSRVSRTETRSSLLLSRLVNRSCPHGFNIHSGCRIGQVGPLQAKASDQSDISFFFRLSRRIHDFDIRPSSKRIWRRSKWRSAGAKSLGDLSEALGTVSRDGEESKVGSEIQHHAALKAARVFPRCAASTLLGHRHTM